MKIERVIFRQRFFSTREAAAAFLHVNRSGDLLHDGADPGERFFFRLAAAIAGLSLEEVAKTPWCVAWEEVTESRKHNILPRKP